MKPVKVAGYVRVSSKGQTDNESLTTQRKIITDFAKKQGYELTEIYADEGISGGSVTDRHALLRCLTDGQEGKFKVIIIYRLSRFGRNARELLNNYDELQQAGIDLYSISEGIDFSTRYGKAILGMLAVIAELEKEIIKEQMLENRVARGKRGIPTAGQLPYARSYNKETGEWTLDEDKAKVIRQVADEYLKGGSLLEIAKKYPISYSNLITVLSKRSGDQWTVYFKDEAPITYEIPRILSDDTIQRIKDRLEFNRTNNRTDILEKYLLTGFIRCEQCKVLLSGHTFHIKGHCYIYYGHRHLTKCKSFSYIHATPIENAVFHTIFENIVDVPNFEKAIAESMPDKTMIRDLELKVKNGEKELKKVQKELDKLVDIALSGTLSKETIHSKEQELLQAKNRFTDEIETDTQQLKSLPDINEVKHEADKIRRMLLTKFSGKKRLNKMTFNDKRALLHWLFDGKDQTGTSYGIYISALGKGKAQTVDYFMYGRIVGLRTLKGDNINYQEENDNYITNIVTNDFR